MIFTNPGTTWYLKDRLIRLNEVLSSERGMVPVTDAWLSVPEVQDGTDKCIAAAAADPW